MIKANLVKRSAQIHHYVREKGHVAWILEQYVNPKRPNLTAEWVVNGTAVFARRKDALNFASLLATEVGGSGQATMESYKTEIKTYSPEAYAAAILG